MATIGTLLYTMVYGRKVGEDDFGNVYYEHKLANSRGRKKRWVIYKGKAEPTKVPPEWHGWLHYMTDRITNPKHEWQKVHIPNVTGTDYAYYPPGHLKAGGKRDKATGDYEAWNPDKS